MAIGDDAAAAGIPTPTGLENANTLAVIITMLADELARRTDAVTPIERGGTGAETAAEARLLLGVRSLLGSVGTNSVNDVVLRWEGTRLGVTIDSTDQGDLATTGDFIGRDAQIADLQAAMAGALSRIATLEAAL
jgi:predicted anti-sigma-YlaC factor YlaD